MTPWLTLYHWDLPQAVQDTRGWPHRDTAHRFTEYALAVHDALGDRVPIWTTLNEPQCSAFVGHIAGQHAPGHTSVTEGLLAAHHLLLAHGQAIRELRARDGGLTLGITLNLAPVDPVDPGDDRDRDAARRLDGQFNRWFLDPLFRGAYPADILRDLASAVPDAANALTAAIHAGDLRTVATPVDALGVNYYQGAHVSAAPAATPPPSGDAPTARGGRSCWPLPGDLYGHDRRFGLVHVDHTTQRRTLKDSAHAYRQIIRTRSVPRTPRETRMTRHPTVSAAGVGGPRPHRRPSRRPPVPVWGAGEGPAAQEASRRSPSSEGDPGSAVPGPGAAGEHVRRRPAGERGRASRTDGETPARLPRSSLA
ncbi:family 1 glycosylhydrolase [Streptosporangium sp. NPDC050855]|uniref:family 1 glycosylhydrolase n=1 Tax=Streptosporangium sp. NPDC050855 TaxID=3366194 RepID=UPI0037B5F17E